MNRNVYSNVHFVPRNSQFRGGITSRITDFGKRNSYRPIASNGHDFFSKGRGIGAPPKGSNPFAGPIAPRPTQFARTPSRNYMSNTHPDTDVINRPVYRAPLPSNVSRVAAPVNTTRWNISGSSKDRARAARESLGQRNHQPAVINNNRQSGSSTRPYATDQGSRNGEQKNQVRGGNNEPQRNNSRPTDVQNRQNQGYNQQPTNMPQERSYSNRGQNEQTQQQAQQRQQEQVRQQDQQRQQGQVRQQEQQRQAEEQRRGEVQRREREQPAAQPSAETQAPQQQKRDYQYRESSNIDRNPWSGRQESARQEAPRQEAPRQEARQERSNDRPAEQHQSSEKKDENTTKRNR